MLTQPVGELFEVTGGGSTGSGMETGSMGNVTVVCGFAQWTWDAGVNTVAASGIYGTEGTASSSNLPGARYWSSSRSDSAGNFWLFGGGRLRLDRRYRYLNDLWQYNPSTGT